jgi:hypothetical protein
MTGTAVENSKRELFTGQSCFHSHMDHYYLHLDVSARFHLQKDCYCLQFDVSAYCIQTLRCHLFAEKFISLRFYFTFLSYLYSDGRQFVDNVCRQKFRIRRIVQEEPYLVAEVEYGIAGMIIS